MVMAQKQNLANKRRSQKRRDKKRARTNRSIRQVNGGVKFMDRLKKPLGLGKSSKLPSEVKTPLLQDAAPVDESTYEQNFSVLSVPSVPSVPSVSSVLSSDLEKEKQFFSESTLDEDLRTLLQLHVFEQNLKITEQNFEITEQNVEMIEQNLKIIYEFIFNPNNRDIVLSPLIEHIKVLFDKNVTITRLLFQTLDDNKYEEEMNSIDTRLNELMNYARKLAAYDLFYSILKQLVLYVSDDKYDLPDFVNKIEAAKTIGTLTFLNIFQDSNDDVTDYDTIQDSKFLREHVLHIKEQINFTAGGSKGKMKSKMSRRNSRTRKM